jgi:hypothetical protein
MKISRVAPYAGLRKKIRETLVSGQCPNLGLFFQFREEIEDRGGYQNSVVKSFRGA